MRFLIVTLLAVSLSLAGDAAAAGNEQLVVAFDLLSDDDAESIRGFKRSDTRVMALTSSNLPSDCAPTDDPPADDRREVASPVDCLKTMFNRDSATVVRWEQPKDATVTVIAFWSSSGAFTPEIKVEEVDVETRFAADVKTLLKLIVKVSAAGDGPQPTIFASIQIYKLTKKRAQLKITATPHEKTVKDDKPAALSTQIRTGPSEHVFLSANLPVTKLQSLRFDEEGRTIQPAETPSEFMIGLDVIVGDLLEENRGFFEGFTLKALLTPSKRPLENVGIGVGYRLPKMKLWGFELDSVSPFAAAVRVSRVEAGEEVVEMKFVGGLSFNLDKALDWVGGDDK